MIEDVAKKVLELFKNEEIFERAAVCDGTDEFFNQLQPYLPGVSKSMFGKAMEKITLNTISLPENNIEEKAGAMCTLQWPGPTGD